MHIGVHEASTLMEKVCANPEQHQKLSVENTQMARSLFDTGADGVCMRATYEKGYEIVHIGSMHNHVEFSEDKNLNYSYVPLGIIIHGEVTVIKGGKATKTLREGDFIGLFETSNWLLTKKKRQIGDWTLIANQDTQILYFGSDLLLHDQAKGFREYLVELARADHVPQPISNLPLLDWVASHTTTDRLSDYAIIAHTHILPNNVPLFRHLSHLVDFGNTFILEKPYSTVREAFHELVLGGFEIIPVHMQHGMPYEFCVQKSLEILWGKIIQAYNKGSFKNLIIIDDGGDVWLSIPWQALGGTQIAGVEQTQRGLTRIEHSSVRLPPIVSVASSGVKKIVESEFIGRSVIKKLNELGIIASAKQIGIMGMGSIGTTIKESLAELGRDAIFYDVTNHIKDGAESSLDSLMNKSDLIIGTTGTDSFKGTPFERVSGHKILVSASSADVEFASLLKLASPSDEPFDTRHVTMHSNLTLDILNGGYPINFDRQGNATPDEDIVLTRCLLYIGAMQAAKIIKDDVQESGIYALDQEAQTKMLAQWIEDKTAAGNPPTITENDISNIVSASSGRNNKQALSVWAEL